MNIANNWKDYEILDMANGEKVERWKDVILARPDPQIIWKDKSFPEKTHTGHFVLPFRSYIKAEQSHISVFHDVVFSFTADQSFFTADRHTS